ncbi:MAG: hypothetical protein Q7L19_06485 [Pseudohongiella sp.]|nr:hypothetical protein [Pseudohongiella sp.]
MSFDILLCDKCHFGPSTIPKHYFKSETGEMLILMYPDGSQSFESRFGYPASKEVIEKGSGWVEEFYCSACDGKSEIADVDEKLCNVCGSSNLVDLSQSEGKPCPRCGSGIVVRKPSLLSI